MEKAEIANMSEEDMTKYNVSLKAYIDRIAELSTAIEEGENKGIKKGIDIVEVNKNKFAYNKVLPVNIVIVRN